MSVQKDRLVRKTSFTTITNNVIDGLQHDLRLLGLYIYLYKKPEVWEFHKEVIQKDCNIGRDLLNRMIKDLENLGLIEIERVRSTDGRFMYNNIHILDGNSFKINPYTENHLLVSSNRLPAAINKDNKIKINKRNIINDKNLSTAMDSYKNSSDFEHIDMKPLDEKKLSENKSKLRELMEAKKKKEVTYNKSTRPDLIEWGPGHPSYDSLYKKE